MKRFPVLVAFWAVTVAACQEKPAPVPELHASLSGEKAFANVQALVDFGPRPAGSDALAASREFLVETLASSGWITREQSFESRTPEGVVEFVNLIARFADGREAEQVWDASVKGLVGSHYETKKYTRFTFVGANDSGSSSGLLVEMARVLADAPPLARQLELVFFDGEEAFVQYTRNDGLYGSRYYAKQLSRRPAEARPEFLVLLDMVGDKDLNVRIPVNGSRRLTSLLLESADALGKRQYFGAGGPEIIDDHVPLAAIGLEVIDIIDLDFDPWHTEGDTMDTISPESLETVGQVALHLIGRLLSPGG